MRENNINYPKIGKISYYYWLLYGPIFLMINLGVYANFNEEIYYILENDFFKLSIALVFFSSFIYFWVLLYQVWRFVIEVSYKHSLAPSIETPGQAIGYLFIPFFNLYWVFQAFGKLPKDINVLAQKQGNAVSMSEGLGLTLAILIMPIINWIGLWINIFILSPIFIHSAIKTCRNIEAFGNNCDNYEDYSRYDNMTYE